MQQIVYTYSSLNLYLLGLYFQDGFHNVSNFINGYVQLLILHFLPLLKPWFIVERQPAYVFSIVIYYFDTNNDLNWMDSFHFFILIEGLLIFLIHLIFFPSSILDVSRMSMSTIYLALIESWIFCLQNIFHQPMIQIPLSRVKRY